MNPTQMNMFISVMIENDYVFGTFAEDYCQIFITSSNHRVTDSLWVTNTIVTLSFSLASTTITVASFSASSDEVASSSSSTDGFRSSTLASASRWHSPPENRCVPVNHEGIKPFLNLAPGARH